MRPVRNNQIVNIRALAIFLVMLGHSIILYSSSWSLYQPLQEYPIFDHLKDVINIIQMPLFFSVSGYCLAYTLRSDHGLRLAVKFKRLMVPFVVVGLCYMIPLRIVIDYPGYVDQSIPAIVFHGLFLGFDNGHLWFLPTLMIIFIATMFLIKALDATGLSNRLAQFQLILSALCFMLLMSPLRSLPYISQALRYYIFFSIGYCLNGCHFIKRELMRGICTVLLVVISFMAYLGLLQNSISSEVASLVAVISIYAIVPEKTNAFLSAVSKNSMGLYLFHSPLLYISFTYLLFLSPLGMLLVNLVLFGSLAFAMTAMLRKIELSFILGE